MPLILTVSVATAAFAWTFDMLLLVPAVLMILIAFQKDSMGNAWVLVGLVLANLGTLAAMWFLRDYLWTFWLPWVIGLLWWRNAEKNWGTKENSLPSSATDT
jgi:hypothetical protein